MTATAMSSQYMSGFSDQDVVDAIQALTTQGGEKCMNNDKLEHCPFCGEVSYQHQIKPMPLQYKSHSITVNQPGYWCNKCQEGVIGGEDRKATQKELQAFRAKIDGLLTPDEIKCIREKLSLTQQKASEIFGGGVNAFSRYERGETPIPKPLSELLHLLNIHPHLLAELTIKVKPVANGIIKKRKSAVS